MCDRLFFERQIKTNQFPQKEVASNELPATRCFQRWNAGGVFNHWGFSGGSGRTRSICRGCWLRLWPCAPRAERTRGDSASRGLRGRSDTMSSVKHKQGNQLSLDQGASIPLPTHTPPSWKQMKNLKYLQIIQNYDFFFFQRNHYILLFCSWFPSKIKWRKKSSEQCDQDFCCFNFCFCMKVGEHQCPSRCFHWNEFHSLVWQIQICNT